MTVFNWKSAFSSLTGNSPFPWQERLYEKLVQGDIPDICDIPTGLGKTMVIVLWLIAIAEQSCRAKITLPRRLVYVVDRRTVVDQSSQIIEDVRNKLLDRSDAHQDFCMVRDEIRRFSQCDDFFHISTLRGELSEEARATSQDWTYDPCSLSISVATIDMAGSKLLFSGYGDSRRKRPLHAGMIGCDTLLIHDEAHLTPAFSRLLRSIKELTGPSPKEIPKFHVLELSATSRQSGPGYCLTIDDTDMQNETVRKRLNAQKKLQFHEVETDGKIKEQIVKFIKEDVEFSQNLTSPNNRVAIFVRSPKDAESICNDLTKAKKTAVLLTGRIRGYEREKLLQMPEMQPFFGKNSSETPIYLVATSAAEVGWDLHADHYVGDLSTLDSMIQRLGRINRFSQVDQSQIQVFYEKNIKEENDYNKARKATLAIFKEIETLGGDVSPLALREYRDREEAFSPKPEEKRLTDILLDFWSFTSIDEALPARPPVEDWLKGDQDDPPQTTLVWRSAAEVDSLCSSEVSNEDVAHWCVKNRITAKERLSMPTYELPFTAGDSRKKIDSWVEKNSDENVLVLYSDGNTARKKLKELDQEQLKFATLVFPDTIGGLTEDGAFNPKTDVPANNLDISDAIDKGLLYELRCQDGDYSYRHLSSGGNFIEMETETESRQTFQQTIQRIAREENKKYVWHVQTKKEDDTAENPASRYLLLFEKTAQGEATKNHLHDSVALTEHHAKTETIMRQFCERLGLPELLLSALQLAAKYHDLGKADRRWQNAAGNDDYGKPIAKSADGNFNWRLLCGYRHELGSVVEAAKIAEIQDHAERDLILHIIAAHHGWSRPHFDSKYNADFAETVYERRLAFAKLQERFGWWGLAWLESLLRRADGIASGESGVWKVESGKWKVESGEWRVESGEWAMVSPNPVD